MIKTGSFASIGADITSAAYKVNTMSIRLGKSGETLGWPATLISQEVGRKREVPIMDIMEAIKSRRSIRSYQDRPVEQDKLNLILEAGRLAPSARNLQDWRFVVVQDKDKRQELSAAARGQAFVAQAPVVIAACGTETEYVMTCGQHCYPIDVTIAMDHMSLMATDLGLGSC